MPLSASEPQMIQAGQSPDGIFGLRQAAQGSIDEPTSLELFDLESWKAIATLPYGGYAAYSMAVDPMNIKCLWAPDSMHFALMHRTTKRTWRTVIYSVSGSTCTKVDAPDFTEIALASLQQKDIFRFLRETPVKWSANDRLEVEVAGDYGSAPKVFRYDGTVILDLTSNKASIPTPLTIKPEEG